jgi:hypothetical protein
MGQNGVTQTADFGDAFFGAGAAQAQRGGRLAGKHGGHVLGAGHKRGA